MQSLQSALLRGFRLVPLLLVVLVGAGSGTHASPPGSDVRLAAAPGDPSGAALQRVSDRLHVPLPTRLSAPAETLAGASRTGPRPVERAPGAEGHTRRSAYAGRSLVAPTPRTQAHPGVSPHGRNLSAGFVPDRSTAPPSLS